MQARSFTHTIAGKTLTATFSDLAAKAHGSVMITCGDTALIAAATTKKAPNSPYFNFVVDYEERNYARGAILGGSYAKREGKPSDEAVLTSRMIDRALRPFFAPSMRDEVQVVITVLAVGNNEDPGPLALLGASLALATSEIPWNGPVSAVRISQTASEWAINPATSPQDATLDLVIAARKGNIVMIDGEAQEATEEATAEALAKGLAEIARLEQFQEDIVAEIGTPKTSLASGELSGAVRELFDTEISPKLTALIAENPPTINAALAELTGSWLYLASKTDPAADKGALEAHIGRHTREMIENRLFSEGKRVDGRAISDIRPIWAQAGGISSVLHGSGTFFRGETHVSSFTTLGSEEDALSIDGMEVFGKKYFLHHYNFPPYSAGETGRIGTPNRRAIGHGALAEKALRRILPSRSEFPYTIRVVSEVFSSNGSTSMASVCAGTLALANAHVPIRSACAGISIGLFAKKPNEYKLLTDIAGLEDHVGDMDFKVAGTASGITAIQLDVKNEGISLEIAREALAAAGTARGVILAELNRAIASQPLEQNLHIPKNHAVTIPEAAISAVIGPGGSTIRGIQRDTGTRISVKPDGTVIIFGTDEAASKAIEIISKRT